MSVTNDAVAVFRNRFLAVIHRGEQKFPQPTVQSGHQAFDRANMVEQGLLAVARDSADIRRDHDAILLKAASLSTLQEDLLAVFERSYQALEQLAEARSHLSKAEAVAKFERDAREAASQRLSGMTATYHQTVSELEKLRPENRQLQAALQQVNEKLARLEDDNAMLNASLTETRAELERKQAQEVAARREHDATKAELASANKFVAQKLLEMSQLQRTFGDRRTGFARFGESFGGEPRGMCQRAGAARRGACAFRQCAEPHRRARQRSSGIWAKSSPRLAPFGAAAPNSSIKPSAISRKSWRRRMGSTRRIKGC